MKKPFIIFFSLIALASCSGGAKEKIAHKWVVSVANWYQRVVGDTVVYNTLNRSVKQSYSGKMYDLRNDGTYSTTGLKPSSGTWDTDGIIVNLKAEKGESETWFFLAGRVEIMADSSMKIFLVPKGTDGPMLVLKPAPGETVETDY